MLCKQFLSIFSENIMWCAMRSDFIRLGHVCEFKLYISFVQLKIGKIVVVRVIKIWYITNSSRPFVGMFVVQDINVGDFNRAIFLPHNLLNEFCADGSFGINVALVFISWFYECFWDYKGFMLQKEINPYEISSASTPFPLVLWVGLVSLERNESIE